MVLSSFTAYLTGKYTHLLDFSIISLPFPAPLAHIPFNTPPLPAFLLNIPFLAFSSFFLLLGIAFVADDGHSRLNLNRPKAGMFLFSVLFGIFLGSILEDAISSLVRFYLGGAFFFFILGLYKGSIKQEENSFESFILGKYVIIFIAIILKIGIGCSFIEVGLTIAGLVFLAFIYFLCISGLEEVYHYYREDKPRAELNYLGAFKLYKGLFKFIWFFLYFYHPNPEEILIKGIMPGFVRRIIIRK